MLHKVRASITRHRMIPDGARVGIAVSGGIDSVVLLDVLREILPAGGVSVIHLNHQLRGADSDSDERFVRNLADRLALPFFGQSAQLAEGNVEQAGREARRALFRQLRDAGAVDVVATGHTLSDQAETVLYRLIRGSGTAGLRGILPVTAEGVIRPLLECTRTDVETWARERGLDWREDHSNADPAFARNHLRHNVLPEIVKVFGKAVPHTLGATASLAADEEDFWTGETARLAVTMFVKTPLGILVRADELCRMHPAVARRLLRRAVADVKGDLRGIDLTHIESLLGLARLPEGHGRVQAPGIDVFRSFEWLRIGRPRAHSRFELDYAYRFDGSEGQFQCGDVAIFLEIRTDDGGANYNTNVDEADRGRMRGPLELRNWHPGDQFHPLGRTRQKIKLLFQEARIPIWDRHLWPVLTCGDEVVWSRGFGVAEPFLPSAETRTFLRVSGLKEKSREDVGGSGVSHESDWSV